MTQRSNGEPGIFDLIIERDKCDKRAEEIEAYFENEYGKLLSEAFKNSWKKMYKESPECSYIEKYSLSNGKILIGFKAWYEGEGLIEIEFSPASFILKEVEKTNNEIMEGLIQRAKRIELEQREKEEVRVKEQETKEIQEFNRLKEKYKQRDLI